MKELGLYRDDHQFGEACSPRWERAGITLTDGFTPGDGSSFFICRHDDREIVWLVCKFPCFGAFRLTLSCKVRKLDLYLLPLLSLVCHSGEITLTIRIANSAIKMYFFNSVDRVRLNSMP